MPDSSFLSMRLDSANQMYPSWILDQEAISQRTRTATNPSAIDFRDNGSNITFPWTTMVPLKQKQHPR